MSLLSPVEVPFFAKTLDSSTFSQLMVVKVDVWSWPISVVHCTVAVDPKRMLSRSPDIHPRRRI